jgi:uncharacterized protein
MDMNQHASRARTWSRQSWRTIAIQVWRRTSVLPLIAAVAALVLLAPLQAAQHNFLWKATGRGGVVYLAGSVHMLSQDYYPLGAALEASFKEADLLVEEVDLNEMLAPEAQLQILSRGMLPGSQTLDQVLSPPTLALVNKTAGGLGAPMEALHKFKPWMLAIAFEGLVLQQGGFDPNLGLDKHFYDLAQAAGKPVQGLETAEYQLSRFDDMTMPQQDRFLADTLKELDTERASVKTLADAWKSGDAPTVERIVLADLKSDPVMYQRLLVERNRNWLPKLDALFSRPGRAFVVVGAAHLVGPDGLLQMLAAKGYTVEQM